MWTIYILPVVCIQLVSGQCGVVNGKCSEHREINDNPGETPRQHTNIIQRPYSTTPRQELQYTSTKTLQLFPSTRADVAKNVPYANLPPRVVYPGEVEYDSTLSESFNGRLFQLMSDAATKRNLVYSPLSLEALLTFIYTFSEGKLLEELARLLNIHDNSANIANTYRSLVASPCNSNTNNTLVLANKLFYDRSYGSVADDIRNTALTSFASDVEPIDFLRPIPAAKVMNSWIAEKTRNLIKYIIDPDSLKSVSSGLFINSLYFKSEWVKKFGPYDTQEHDFYVSQRQKVSVNMMYNEDLFRYGEFDELKAKVIEMPYKLDDFTMMIVLPNEIEGLADVEKRLSQTNIHSIAKRLQTAEVEIQLPQFKIEYEVDMRQPLQQLGVYSLFNSDASIKLFKDQKEPLVVDQIKHKTYIDVNEAGTEAAAVTFAKIVPLSIKIGIKKFTADHPFIFVIRNSKAIYFMGHVAKLPGVARVI